MPSTRATDKKKALTEMAKRLDPFHEIIDRFGLLLTEQAEIRDTLEPAELGKFVVEEERFLNGEPLTSFLDSDQFAESFRKAASGVWPLLGMTFPTLSETLSGLEKLLENDGPWTSLCLRAVVHGDAEALETAAGQAAVSPDFLLIALRAAYAPCVAAHKQALTALAPVELWRKAYCPVCGSDPDVSVLENHPDPSDFLVSKSGEVWHHCPICTHRWRFVRVVCPGCGNQDHKQLTRFSLSDNAHEQIYTCEKCRQYLPCLNLVERTEAVDYDLIALGLIHLDAAAQAKGYVPLSPAPWVALGLAEDQAETS